MKAEINQGDASVRQDMPSSVSNTTEATGQAWNRFYVTALRRNHHTNTLTSDLSAPEPGDNIFVV